MVLDAVDRVTGGGYQPGQGFSVEFKPRDKTRTTYWVAVKSGASRELRSEFSSAFAAYPLSESSCRF